MAAESTRRIAFLFAPEGPENALALFVMAEAFRADRGEEITEAQRAQTERALLNATNGLDRLHNAAS